MPSKFFIGIKGKNYIYIRVDIYIYVLFDCVLRHMIWQKLRPNCGLDSIPCDIYMADGI